MRVKRFKKFQRYLSYFQQHFKFQTPFQILVDGTFANSVLANKVNMREQFPKYLDGECKLMTTPCAIIEAEKLGPSLYGAVKILKELQLHKCPHAAEPIPASTCLKAAVRKLAPKKSAKEEVSSDPNDHFIVATQDANLRSECREVIGVPLLYLHGCAPTMEKPSAVSCKWAEKRERRKLEVSGYHKDILQQIKGDTLPSSSDAPGKGTRKRKRAGPNPLSCKKSKRSAGTGESAPGNSEHQQDVKKKRKRIKVRVPKHVRDLAIKD